MYFLISIIYST